MHTLHVTTPSHEAMVDITAQLEKFIQAAKIKSGALVVYAPHTTTGLTTNEGAVPSVCRDILTHLRNMVPLNADFLHAEGNSDAHIKATLFGSSVYLIVEDGRLALGTW